MHSGFGTNRKTEYFHSHEVMGKLTSILLDLTSESN